MVGESYTGPWLASDRLPTGFRRQPAKCRTQRRGITLLEITTLRPEDRADWERLARAYKAFYETTLPDAQYDLTWHALAADKRLHGLAARRDGAIVGIVHFVFHANVWSHDVCYLQDLFVAEPARGRGVARALITRVAEVARGCGAARVYWHTHQDNTRARSLYDRIGRFRGFIRYDYRMAGDDAADA